MRSDLILATWKLPGLTDMQDLVLDGGGLVFEPSTRRAVLTDRVLKDNPSLAGRHDESGKGAPKECCPADPYANHTPFTAAEIEMGQANMRDKLGASAVAILPEDPVAPRLGHIDGTCNWLAPGVVALSDFASDGGPELHEINMNRIKAAFGADVMDSSPLLAFM
eukprot:gnl/TRDRNA2_/TRDRNA2_166722_c0_seq1.p1 gnl/TRDRNA2_/TRDRNA2_166722_c0~~gnl/TRDRNA2_/TRDRNA2_166722_c0_seq1.p1  ORF type:complete len:165 (-),score=31.24 gnl/TRDRNA2_/TRDRNA2_166722_c0_seq1:407-901(-)